MLPENAFELRDADGTYLLARPLSRGRCQVLLSNLYSEGDILRKGDPAPWSAAAAENGLGTRLSPHELHDSDDDLDLSDQEGRPDDEDVLRDTHERVEARSRTSIVQWTPRASSGVAAPAEADPAALALRLMIHYLVVHEKSGRNPRRVEICRCDRFAPGSDLALASLHAIVYSAVRRRTGPGLARIQAAIARATRSLMRKEAEEIRPALAA
jgi:predicted RNA-binding Zn ribbon-like protein